MDSQANQQSLKRKLPPSITGENDVIMQNRKVKWSKEEEEGLIAGVRRYGVGMWKTILSDADFAEILAHRSNVDLKDKWRNITSRGMPSPGSKEKPITLESGTEVEEEVAASTFPSSLAAETAKGAEKVLKGNENIDSILQLVKKHLEKDPQIGDIFLGILKCLDKKK